MIWRPPRGNTRGVVQIIGGAGVRLALPAGLNSSSMIAARGVGAERTKERKREILWVVQLLQTERNRGASRKALSENCGLASWSLGTPLDLEIA